MVAVDEVTLHKARSGWGCKIGTMPAVVRVHGADIRRIKPGEWIRVRWYDREPWSRVLVRSVDPDSLHFQADR